MKFRLKKKIFSSKPNNAYAHLNYVNSNEPLLDPTKVEDTQYIAGWNKSLQLTPESFNTVCNHIDSDLADTMVKGIQQYSPYWDYPAGSVVEYKGKLYLSRQAIVGLPEPSADKSISCSCDFSKGIRTSYMVELSTGYEAPNSSSKWVKIITEDEIRSLKNEFIQLKRYIENTIK